MGRTDAPHVRRLRVTSSLVHSAVSETRKPPTALQTICRFVTALMFAGVGVMHFVDPDPFVAIVPPALPAPRALVYVSGACEIAGGLGLLFAKTRTAAAWGLLALLVAVFPANIYMAVEEVYLPDMPESKLLLWGRLPFQLLFAAMVAWGGELWPRKRGG